MNTRFAPLVGFAFVAALLGFGISYMRNNSMNEVPSPLIGKPAPAFDLPLLHEPNKRVTNADLAGQPYVMNIWGSWCPECRVEHPVLTQFALTKRVRFIGYNLKDERPDALRWLEQFGNPYMMVLADVEGRTAIDWGIYGAPETFLVDGNGVIRWKHVGAIDQAIIDHQLIPALEKIEAGR